MDKIIVNHKELKVLYGSDSYLKYINIRINSYGQIEILTSRFMDYNKNEIFTFIKENTSYIQSQLNLLKKMNLPTFKNESKVNILGKEYVVYRSKRIQKIIREGNGIVIPKNYSIEKIKYYLENLLKEVINEFMFFYIEHYKFEYQRIQIVESDQYWGRCVYERQRVWEHLEFNIALVFFPTELIDYVVLHELCHLIHHNHSRSFWNEVKRIMPDAKERERILHANCLRWYLERLGIKRVRCY